MMTISTIRAEYALPYNVTIGSLVRTFKLDELSARNIFGLFTKKAKDLNLGATGAVLSVLKFEKEPVSSSYIFGLVYEEYTYEEVLTTLNLLVATGDISVTSNVFETAKYSI